MKKADRKLISENPVLYLKARKGVKELDEKIIQEIEAANKEFDELDEEAKKEVREAFE